MITSLKTASSSSAKSDWPAKVDLFGIGVSCVTIDAACEAILRAARLRESTAVSAFSVHALIEVVSDARLADKVNNFAMITPDGQPVRWALNWLYSAGLRSNVRGSDLFWKVCEQASYDGVPIYLYGGTGETLALLRAKLVDSFPGIQIVGAESPPFRPLTPQEDAEMVARVNDSKAGIVCLGLGSPKQDQFAAAHVGRIHAVQLCIGAAFDFMAGTKATAPLWMQGYGLEWVFRLWEEPGRLWKRYLVTNTTFVALLLMQLIRRRHRENVHDSERGQLAFEPHQPSLANRRSNLTDRRRQL